jgi:hypothetical protein
MHDFFLEQAYCGLSFSYPKVFINTVNAVGSFGDRAESKV